MQTAEELAMTLDYLRAEMSVLEYQLNRLEDIALSVENPELERDLRTVAMDIRKCLEGMRGELEPSENVELVA